MISINISSDYENRLDEMARNENTTISEIVENALQMYFVHCYSQPTPYQLGKELFGRHGSGKGDLSQNYKKILKEKLREKHTY